MKKTYEINKHGFKIEVGKTYYYYNKGLGEIKSHTVRYFNSIWTHDHDGRVETNSLHPTQYTVTKKDENL